MDGCRDSVAVLSGELAPVEACIAGLSSDDGARITELDPYDESAARWMRGDHPVPGRGPSGVRHSVFTFDGPHRYCHASTAGEGSEHGTQRP